MANYFRSMIIDWLLDEQNKENILTMSRYLEENKRHGIINEFVIKLGSDVNTLTNCIIELYVFSKISLLKDIPIIIYNDDNDILYIFDNGLVYDKHNDTQDKYKKYTKINIKQHAINMRFGFIGDSNIPNDIEVIYYK